MVRRASNRGGGVQKHAHSRPGVNREISVNRRSQGSRRWLRHWKDYHKARQAFLVALATAAGANAWTLVERLAKHLWALTFYTAWLTLPKGVPYVPFW